MTLMRFHARRGVGGHLGVEENLQGRSDTDMQAAGEAGGSGAGRGACGWQVRGASASGRMQDARTCLPHSPTFPSLRARGGFF